MTNMFNFLFRALVSLVATTAFFTLASLFAESNSLVELYHYHITLDAPNPLWSLMLDVRNELQLFGVIWLFGTITVFTMNFIPNFGEEFSMTRIVWNLSIASLICVAFLSSVQLIERGGGYLWMLPLALLSVLVFTTTPNLFKSEQLAPSY